ncbi:MAG: hypothetical protein ABH849_00630 [Nanoarchaeota archaeon]
MNRFKLFPSFYKKRRERLFSLIDEIDSRTIKMNQVIQNQAAFLEALKSENPFDDPDDFEEQPEEIDSGLLFIKLDVMVPKQNEISLRKIF